MTGIPVADRREADRKYIEGPSASCRTRSSTARSAPSARRHRQAEGHERHTLLDALRKLFRLEG